jgi:hypothetical protein
MNNLFFVPHLGLGDHFLTNGLLRFLSKDRDIVAMPVKQNNFWTIRRMFADMENLCLIPLDGSNIYTDDFHVKAALALKDFYKQMGYETLGVGHFGERVNEFYHFLNSGGTPDVFFYKELGVDIQVKYDFFKIHRSHDREKFIFDSFDIEPGKYAFLHDDPSRGRTIDRSHISKDLKIITPSKKFYSGDIVDYGMVIENAAELHYMNSSFSDLSDFMDLSRVNRRVMHLYARTPGDPECSVSYRHEFDIIR